MEVISRTIYHKSKSDEFKFTLWGDVQYGARGCDIQLAKKVVNHIANDSLPHYGINMGDNCDNIHPGDPRFLGQEQDQRLRPKDYDDAGTRQARSFVDEIAAPIKEKNLLWLKGNHEFNMLSRHGIDVHRRMLERLYGIDQKTAWSENAYGMDGGYSCYLRLRFVREAKSSTSTREIVLGLHHGYGGGRMPGGKINNMDKLFNVFPDADAVAMGHVHALAGMIKAKNSLAAKRNAIYRGAKVGVICGTFLRSYEQYYTTYSERAAFEPAPLGCVTLKIAPWYADERPRIGYYMDTEGLPL